MKRILSIILVVLIALTCGCGAQPEMRDISTLELVEEMGLGINLGNTFEAGGTWVSPKTVTALETAWGSPVVTEELIKGYKEGGFGVVRVPTNWSNLMTEDYTLDFGQIVHIREVVGWIIDNGMYAILNIHHEGWLKNMPTEHDECMKRYTRFWEQISEAFSDYDDHLMFESLNEDGGWDNVWNSYAGDEGKEEAYGYLNEINQKFVDIVRASGGNNPQRHLLIAGYYTGIETTCDPLFKMPDDPVSRCAVSVHYYNPSVLTLIDKDVSWGKARTDWGTEKDYTELAYYLDMMKTTFVDKGIPVIVGEYGCFGDNKTEEVRRNYTVDVTKAIYERGMCPVLWDSPGNFYNRLSFKFNDTIQLEEMMKLKGNENAQK